jgi:chromosome segregation ATPase
MHKTKMMLESSPSSESAVAMVSARCNQAEGNRTQNIVIAELTKTLAEREAELRLLHREKAQLENKRSNIKGSPVELEKAYESLMSHLGQREEEFRAIAQKNEYLVKRQHELEKITRELHNTMKFQRSVMHEKNDKLEELQKQLGANTKGDGKEVDKLRRQITVALDSQREAVNNKNELLKKLAAAEKTVKQMQADIDQHVVWQNETMIKATHQEKVLAEKDSKISKLAAKNNELRAEIEHQREFVKNAKVQGEQKDSMLESAQEEITMLHAKVEELQEEIVEQKRIIHVFEQRFVTKGQNILELNSRVEQAEKMWAKIEEREKRFTLKECANHLLREENDNLRLEERKLKSEIDELNEAFEQYKLHFAQDGERIDMAYFLSKLRETVKLNNRIEQLEKVVEEKGYVVDIYKAECELREKERTVMAGIEAVGEVLSMLKSVLNEEEVEAPRVIGKLEESLLLWQEKTCESVKVDSEKSQKHVADLEIDVAAHDSQDNSVDYDEDEDDDITLNSGGFSMSKYVEDARCVDFRQFAHDKNGEKFLEVVKHMQVGLKSFKKEGMSIAADVNAFFTQEIQEMAMKMDKRDDHEERISKSGSTSRRG